MYLEHVQWLDVDEEIHILALHLTYIPIINEAINLFVEEWNNHPISTQSNYSPRQLWFLGMIGGEPPSCAVQDIILGQNEIDSFGVDETEAYVIEEEDQRVVVPPCPYVLTEQQNEIIQNIRQAFPADSNGTETYFAVREYLGNVLS